jgi:salicylate hydroxylase
MSAIHPSVWEGYQKIASFNGWPEKQKVWFEFSVGDKVNGNEGVKIAEVEMADGQTQSTCHRAHFLDVLVKLLPEGCAEFDKRLVGVDEKEVGDNKKLVIRFADGTTAEADAVVGCDGIRSATRSVVFGANSPLSKPQFTGKVAYRGLTPMAKAVAVLGNDKAENRQMYLGHQGHVLTFGVARGTLLNVVAFHTAKNKDKWEGEWIQPLQKDSLDRDFVGWGQQVTKLMDVSLLLLRDVYIVETKRRGAID